MVSRFSPWRATGRAPTIAIAEQTQTRLTLVRHGESVVTVDRVVGGPRTCSGLSPLGHQQAQRLRERYVVGHEPGIDAIWASTMPRAIETAEAMNAALRLTLNIEEDFEERRPGDADGVAWDDYSATFGDFRLLDNPHRQLAPNGESQAQFDLRVNEAFDVLLQNHVGLSVAVVCHGGVVDVVMRKLLKLPPTGGFYLGTKNTSLTEFVATTSAGEPFVNPTWRLERYNDIGHLAGLPASTNGGDTAAAEAAEDDEG